VGSGKYSERWVIDAWRHYRPFGHTRRGPVFPQSN
jgi:hypothetical protein